MTELGPDAAGASGFTMLGGDDSLTCTDVTCLLPGVPGPVTTEPAPRSTKNRALRPVVSDTPPTSSTRRCGSRGSKKT